MESLNDQKVAELKKVANDIRKDIIRMLSVASSGHTAGALGMADIFAILYFHILKHDPKDPYWPKRDRLILSNGHICPVLYATMANAGYFNKDELLTLRKFGSRLQGHPHREYMPFLETSSGPLGSGLSQAVGMAIADKIYGGDNTFYTLLSDGELDEGNIWEAILLATKEKLSRLIIIIDRNNIQIGGNTEKVLPLAELKDKFKAFNCNVEEINGHDFREINNAIYKAKNNKVGPFVIIANTTPGKGIVAWENDYHWHGKAPTKEEAELAILELDKNYA
ncbi:MAG: transketolase [Candidatus Moranbacteria bacterium]|nr:transketolase [Candidatus Moranbacteria bacterium]